jgi:hypothetical protein
MNSPIEEAAVAILQGIGSLIPLPGVGAVVSIAAKPLVETLAELLDGDEIQPATRAQLEAINNLLKNLPPLPGGED